MSIEIVYLARGEHRVRRDRQMLVQPAVRLRNVFAFKLHLESIPVEKLRFVLRRLIFDYVKSTILPNIFQTEPF